MNPHRDEPLFNQSFAKSNDLIRSKYNSSLMEDNIMDIAITRIEINAKDKEYPLEAKLYPGELKRILGDSAHIYRDLKKITKKIIGHIMFIEDGKGNFKAFSMVPNADYTDGVFTIKFNPELKNHLLGLEQNFTSFELAMSTSFKKHTSKRIYALLKKDAYKIPNPTEDNPYPYFQIEYNLSELKFIIGIANNDNDKVKDAFGNMGKYVDWDELYEKLDNKDKKYIEWRDFKRGILDPAKEELETFSDIKFEYEGIREGLKYKTILFKIYRNTPQNNDVINEKMKIIEQGTKPRQTEIPYDMYSSLYNDYIGYNDLSKDDITLLLTKAGYNENRVRNAINLANKASENTYISSYMGWLVKCIENNWDSTPILSGSSETARAATQILEEHNKTKGDVAKKAWEKTKDKENFGEYVSYLLKEGLTLSQMEEIYTPQEMVQNYIHWNMNH